MSDEEVAKKNVLIVEDDQALQKLLHERLEKNGVNAIAVETGQQALNTVKDTHVDLILLDIMLPGHMNGFDVLERIKANAVLKKLPVIVMTNLDTEQKTALDIGAIDYIVKANMSLDELVLKVKNHLQEV